MDWLLVVAFLGWVPAWYAGYRMHKPVERTLAMEAPPESQDGRFLVVARTSSGARARQMYERGQAGKGESLELWDGITCRGRKGPTEG